MRREQNAPKVLAGAAAVALGASLFWGAHGASGQTLPPGANAGVVASSSGSAGAGVTPAASPAPASTSSAAAQATSQPAGAAPVAASQKAVPAVSRLAEQLARSLGAVPAKALVVTGPLASDVATTRGDKLALLIAQQLAGRVGNAAKAHGEIASLPAARGAAAAAGAPVVVHLAIEIAAGKVRVTADELPVPQTVWARIRDPEPGPIAHAFAEAPIDAEIRSHLPAIPLVTAQLQVERGRNFEADVVALACGDLDGDGSSEIAAVSRRRVTTSRIHAGKVEPLRGRAWTDLAGVSPAPLREPFAFATLVERGAWPDRRTTLDVALTDRAASVRFERGLEVEATFPGLAVPDGAGVACTRMGGLVVTGALGPCRKDDPAPLAPSVGGQYDAFASAAMVSAAGQPFVVWAGREKGVVELRDDASHAAKVTDMGAQLAVGDLDQDGDPEILGSVDTLTAADDAVLIRTWRRATGKIEERMKIPAAAGVRALAVCPPDGPGHAPFLVATADEIWVVR